MDAVGLLQTERKRRIKTEKRLRMAEDSLKRLDRVSQQCVVYSSCCHGDITPILGFEGQWCAH